MDDLDFDLSQQTPQKKGPDFRDFLRAAWRKKWLLIIPLITCMIGGVLIAAFWPKRYTSKAALYYPRKAIPEEEMSAQQFRFHQQKFREVAEGSVLKVTNPENLKNELLGAYDLIDPNKAPSLGYSLKEKIFGLHRTSPNPGMDEQLDDIINHLRIQIGERDSILRIEYSGTSIYKAVETCKVIFNMLRKEDELRLSSLENEIKERKRLVDDDTKAIEDKKLQIESEQETPHSSMYVSYLRDRLNTLSYRIRFLTDSEVGARKNLHLALNYWKSLSKDAPPEKEEGELEEGRDKLAGERLKYVTEFLENNPPSHPDYSDAMRMKKNLEEEVQIEEYRINRLGYELPKLEKKDEELRKKYKKQQGRTNELHSQIDAKIAEEGSSKSKEIKALKKQLAILEKETSDTFNEITDISAELSEYRRLKRIMVDAALMPEEEPDGDESGDDSSNTMIEAIDKEKLLEERKNAMQSPEGVSEKWLMALEGLISYTEEFDTIKNEIDRLKNDEANIKIEIKEGMEAAQNIRVLENEYEKLYDRLEKEKIKLQRAQDSMRTREKMVPWVYPQEPSDFSSPNILAVILVFTFLGLVIGGTLVVISELTDHTLKNSKDLKNITKQQILASIPSLVLTSGALASNQSLFYRTKKEVERDIERGALFDRDYLRDIRFRSIATEQMRKLRIAMFESETGQGERPRTILVTSALAGEGKSTVAANLALAISQMIGEYVLLVDSDLRQPDINNFFDMMPKPGLAEYLAEDIDLADLLVKTKFDKLSLLHAGKVPANSTELLYSDKMRNLIKELRSRYSDRYIIIDSPPMLSSSEPEVLAEQVDGIILVVRAGMTPREIIEDMLSQLNPDKIIGIVMNDVKSGINKYYTPIYAYSA